MTADVAAVRLDRAVLERGLARSRTQAQTLIRDGRVRVDGTVQRRPSHPVGPAQTLDAETDPYVSRAAHKLAGALDDLGLHPAGRCLDAGASTGGFTQILLQRGAEVVYAVDVGTAQLAPAVRTNPRVRVRERTNLRGLVRADLDNRGVDVVVADVSFISLTLLLAPFAAVSRPRAWWLLLVKPQFEVGREALEPGGVVRTPRLRRGAVTRVVDAARPLGWHPHALVPSRLPGSAGNQEFFVHLRAWPPRDPVDLDASVDRDIVAYAGTR